MIDKLMEECRVFIEEYKKENLREKQFFLQTVSMYHWLSENKNFVKKDEDILTFVHYSFDVLKGIKEIADASDDIEYIKERIIEYVSDKSSRMSFYYEFDVSLCVCKRDVLLKIQHNEKYLNLILARYNSYL